MEENKKVKEVSRSKQKRQDREKKLSAQKITAKTTMVVSILVAIVVIAAIIGGITYKIIESSKEIKPSSDFSGQLEDNGFVKGVKAADYVTIPDYQNLVIPASEIEYTEAELDEDIQAALELRKTLNTEEGTVAQGDLVNIDYIGTIDGVEFDGGNSNGQGYDLEIGSHSFIDDFEDQLVGYRVGETLNVEVTFPENYSSVNLAGQDAVFEVTINGIYELPELTDEFVAENLKAYGTTVNDYFKYLRDTNEEEKLTTYIENYIAENTTVISYPKKYLKNVQETLCYADHESYDYMNQMYAQYYGQTYSSFEEYLGISEEQYQEELVTRSEENAKLALAYQAILENENITITEDETRDYINNMYGVTDEYDELVELYGKGYAASQLITDKAIDIVKGYAKVN